MILRWDVDNQNISTHAPHAGSDFKCEGNLIDEIGISTHAPHAGSDNKITNLHVISLISTHAPHAGSDFNTKQLKVKS